jgi:hypothetical protein
LSITIAMVPLGPNARLSASEIEADLSLKWPALPSAEPGNAADGQFALRIGSQDIIVAEMPVPIPWTDLEELCAASWLWPDATGALKQHETHLIVTALSDAGPVERATLLTQVIASILATCPEAMGVYWGDATLVVPSALFQEMAVEVLPSGLPLYLWVDFRVGKSAEGQLAGFTTGLSALGHMEFETLDSPESLGELRERFFGLADYVLTNGRVIQDGDTIGADAKERIRVVYSDSAFGHQGKVMRLEYQEVASKKPWWRPW